MGHFPRPSSDSMEEVEGVPRISSSGNRSPLARVAVVGLVALFSLGAACQELALRLQELAPARSPQEAVPEPPPRLEAVAEEVQITTDPSPELWPQISPDGNWLVSASQKTGNFELFLLQLSNPRLQYQLTTSSGDKCRATQSPDGQFFLFDRLDPAKQLFSLFKLARMERQDVPLIERAIHVLTPDLTVDGQRLAFGLAEQSKPLSCVPPLHEALAAGQPSLWVANPDGGAPVHLGRGFYPRWSRDGKRLAFVSLATGNADIWTINIDGSELTQITTDPSHEIDPAWSPDGTRLVFASDRRTRGNFDLWMLDFRDGRLIQLTANPGHDGGPAWSPDGRYIYYHSFRNGNWDIYRVAPVLQ